MATYTVLLAAALPSLTRSEIYWQVSLAEGYALIHARRIHDGQPMIWPRLEQSPVGRWWQQVKKWVLEK